MPPVSRASRPRLRGHRPAVEFVIVLAVLAIVVVVLAAPFRRSTSTAEGSSDDAALVSRADEGARADLEAAREAKYREIRDAELDHRTGKLSDEDFAAVDGALRAEAMEILRTLDAAREHASSTET
jgi:acetyl-CoA acetyltransferase